MNRSNIYHFESRLIIRYELIYYIMKTMMDELD